MLLRLYLLLCLFCSVGSMKQQVVNEPRPPSSFKSMCPSCMSMSPPVIRDLHVLLTTSSLGQLCRDHCLQVIVPWWWERKYVDIQLVAWCVCPDGSVHGTCPVMAMAMIGAFQRYALGARLGQVVDCGPFPWELDRGRDRLWTFSSRKWVSIPIDASTETNINLFITRLCKRRFIRENNYRKKVDSHPELCSILHAIGHIIFA